MKQALPLFLVCLLLLVSCRKEKDKSGDNSGILIDSVSINGIPVDDKGTVDDVGFSSVSIRISFNTAVDTGSFNKNKVFISNGIDTSYFHRFDENSKSVVIKPYQGLRPLTLYRFLFDTGSNLGSSLPEGFSFVFITRIDTTAKFVRIPDDSLLTLVQKRTFRYFWDYAHPVSGLARERLGSGDIVTSGGSGFGIMSIIVAIERNFITRQEGFERLSKIVGFLGECDRFHGAYPHWLNGATGKVQPFSPKDNGGDLVETAFLMKGLLTAREYFRNGSPEERVLCDSITSIWEGVDWDWYRNNQNKLFWHWSPDFRWEMNMPVSGWNEALIVYVLAASSPSHPITREVYDEGWARNGTYPMLNGNTFYGVQLPLGEDYGGPLFFAHFSFLGLDPRNLEDRYASYMEQNVAHTLINHRYCIDNPKNRKGYGRDVWGLTASDIQGGYSASSPLNDLGVVAPTAAISSMPYTPGESLRALRYYYYVLGDRIWGEYGFYDSFNLSKLWFADSFLAINQGPIVCMIENYRSGLLWKLFMSSEEITAGLAKLGFTF